MTEESATSVSAAFEILLEEIEEEVDLTHRHATEFIQASEYQKATEAIERAKQITDFRDRLARLQGEWEEQEAALVAEAEDEIESETRRHLGRLPKGSRTPHRAFYRPILTVLVEMDGAGQAGDVINAIEPLMKPILKEVEFTPLPSQPEQERWRNPAHWSRHRLVREGLLKDDSPRGLWEVSDQGREWLNDKSNR